MIKYTQKDLIKEVYEALKPPQSLGQGRGGLAGMAEKVKQVLSKNRKVQPQ